MYYLKVLLFSVFFWSAASFAQLTVLPEKVIFEPGQRSVKLNLMNKGSETYTYRIGWEDVVMTPEGGLATIDDKNVLRRTPAASSMIRFAPRQVILSPGESQAVRVMVRRPPSLEDGEYRSHMLFQRLQAVQAIDVAKTENSIGLSMGLLIGTSIPVSVRQGDGYAKVAIESASLAEKNDGKKVLNLNLKRTGAYSSRIKIRVYSAGQEEKPLMVGLRALYTDHEVYRLALPFSDGAVLESINQLNIEIEYTVDGNKKDKVHHTLSI